jgi:hypothetical protein
MSRVIIRRRPDGIVQIRPRPLWRAVAGPIPAAILGLLVVATALLAALAAALVRFPVLVLLICGLVSLVLAAVRWTLHGQDEAHAGATAPRPPRDAA